MAVPSKADQVAESAARQEAGVGPGDASAVDVIDDGARGDPGPAPHERSEPAPDARPREPQQPARNPFEDRRKAIIDRFRSDRGQEADDARDEISDFARSGMPPEFEPPAPAEDPPMVEADGDAAPAADPEPARAPTVKIKVRGEEREVPLDEVLSKAQIAYAADSYLDEAKARLDSVKALESEVRTRAPREGQNGAPHPAASQTAHPTEPNSIESADPQHPEDQVAKLIETIQFGDPAEARALLEHTLSTVAESKVDQRLAEARLKDEGARTAKVLKDFEDQNPDIAKDHRARAAIESEVVQLQMADLTALGIDPNQLRQDGQPSTPADIALAHRYYRTEGFNVRSPAELLKTATENFNEWRGVKREPTADPARAAPRVEVTVDRTARRAAIPQQPTRTSAPPSPQQAAPQPRDRSQIVQQEMARRNRPRGKVGIGA